MALSVIRLAIGLARLLFETRCMPGFIHERWKRCFEQREGEKLLVQIFGDGHVGPLEVGHVWFWRALPHRWFEEVRGDGQRC